MGITISFVRHKAKFDQARFYWRMTFCTYQELSSHSGISLDMARRWELRFVKEKQKEKQNVKK